MEWQCLAGQNNNISDTDGVEVDMVGRGRTFYQYKLHEGGHAYVGFSAASGGNYVDSAGKQVV